MAANAGRRKPTVSICDFLFSADLCVPSAGAACRQLIDWLGLPQPGPAAHVAYPDEGWDVIFALVNKAFAAAPTRLEIIAPLAGAAPGAAGPGVFTSQAPRAWRTHATVVATPCMDALAERVMAAGARCWLQSPTEDVPFTRLWMGAAPGDLADYDPAADAGFRFEFIPSQSSAFAPRLFLPPQDQPRPGEAGFRRIRSRAFLVSDIDASLRHLERLFGWEPAFPVWDEPGLGYRFVDMSANHGHGATLRLVAPTDPDSRAGRDLVRHGPGPYVITIAAFDLAAAEADLRARGAPIERIAAGRHEPERLYLELQPGAPFAFTPDA
jgi:hypothetical protein